MARKEECDQYAAELTRRFDELVQWALAKWPKPEFPLLSSDFGQSRREISQIVGSKLGDGDACTDAEGSVVPNDQGQFRGINPMPWP
ncbi:hypothetical protein EGT07_18090 [Herbaspirillum sp. HC18]|nr:hypothetical protein EGT07_18090 [Herbaspirillum sp. HC18]